MARKAKPVPGSRGERVQFIKDAVEKREHAQLTVVQIADRLNDVAADLGLEQRWNGPRFSKMVHGQEPALEDAACLVQLDPEERGWDWLVFGRRTRAKKETKERRVG